ncbi:hypothetical protein R6V09_10970 [Streptomyces sp. W16]|uniref:hypothetical protein n=1 Tax=Streptomyces sp. W16 TaxID=3076631 RepID=UPI00295C233A|nr:hypothetical protein [Streptomyces sp. W16]MDV9170654.1 hypothetical protein [Streptomyces sp. W16]
MFAAVSAVGINTLLIVAVSIGVGMLPVAALTIYHAFPTWLQLICGSAVTSAALVAFLLNLLFNHMPGRRKIEPEPGSVKENAQLSWGPFGLCGASGRAGRAGPAARGRQPSAPAERAPWVPECRQEIVTWMSRRRPTGSAGIPAGVGARGGRLWRYRG